MPGVRPGPEQEPGADEPVAAAAGEPDPGPAEAPVEAAEEVPGEAPGEAPPGPADPAPLGVGRTPTGVPDVDARLDRLADADDLPVSSHLEVYEDVHRGLRDTLTALDRRPGPPAPPAPSP
ncbi:hypothetical protein EEJ42_05555 [Streptomyces botrytidirepellens]|uniref:Uncharacterized protein n=2 Tax=Streptomyces botrytidirepellens TaxID=2486417 RepID=A0A3M8WX86_9ACTN|nr:hypothetical protein EEJ42_05555 [Streptomyces botrytidirepellens]